MNCTTLRSVLPSEKLQAAGHGLRYLVRHVPLTRQRQAN